MNWLQKLSNLLQSESVDFSKIAAKLEGMLEEYVANASLADMELIRAVVACDGLTFKD